MARSITSSVRDRQRENLPSLRAVPRAELLQRQPTHRADVRAVASGGTLWRVPYEESPLILFS